mgnify:CR=1 FL=1
MNIDTMQAGPEMDALVATKVMGWSRDSWAETEGWEAGVRFTGHWKEAPTALQFAFRPSTNIAHAFEVMEKVGGMTLTQYGDRWACAAEREPMLEMMDMRYGETAPLAICRAALAAVTT